MSHSLAALVGWAVTITYADIWQQAISKGTQTKRGLTSQGGHKTCIHCRRKSKHDEGKANSKVECADTVGR